MLLQKLCRNGEYAIMAFLHRLQIPEKLCYLSVDRNPLIF